jgi:hypothetical protein
MNSPTIRPEPLHKDARELAYYSMLCADGRCPPELIARLLAAEQFWREAVKNAEMIREWDNAGTGGDLTCPFCAQQWNSQAIIEHKDDCPYFLAQ